MIVHTFVIFSMFLTDFKRNSISRSVAMLRALGGAAPSVEGCAARRATVRRASMAVDERKESLWRGERWKCFVAVCVGETRLVFPLAPSFEAPLEP